MRARRWAGVALTWKFHSSVHERRCARRRRVVRAVRGGLTMTQTLAVASTVVGARHRIVGRSRLPVRIRQGGAARQHQNGCSKGSASHSHDTRLSQWRSLSQAALPGFGWLQTGKEPGEGWLEGDIAAARRSRVRCSDARHRAVPGDLGAGISVDGRPRGAGREAAAGGCLRRARQAQDVAVPRVRGVVRAARPRRGADLEAPG